MKNTTKLSRWFLRELKYNLGAWTIQEQRDGTITAENFDAIEVTYGWEARFKETSIIKRGISESYVDGYTDEVQTGRYRYLMFDDGNTVVSVKGLYKLIVGFALKRAYRKSDRQMNDESAQEILKDMEEVKNG